MSRFISSTYSQEELSIAAVLLSLRGVRSDSDSSTGSTTSAGSDSTGSASSAGSDSTDSASGTGSASSAGSDSTGSASSAGSGSTGSASIAGSASSAGSGSTGSASSAGSSGTSSQPQHLKKSAKTRPSLSSLEAGPSRVVEEDAGDFSPSDSSWAPSEDEGASEEESRYRRGQDRTRRLKRRRHCSNSSVQTKRNKIENNNNYNNGAKSESPQPRSLESPESPPALDTPASPTPSDSIQFLDEHEDEEIYARMQDKEEDMVILGSGRTTISREKFQKVKWDTYTKATRGLLVAVFSRGILATHSLTGKRSPAFLNKPPKNCLDPVKVADVVQEVVGVFNIKESLVRTVITTKCADESKMLRMRQGRAAESNNLSDDQEQDEDQDDS